MSHDFFFYFSRFWWLIFPLFWMGMKMTRAWQRHALAQRALEIIQTYASQGKEPPPELLAALQPGWGDCGPVPGSWYASPLRYWHQAFFFAALACAFGFMAFYWPWMAGYPHPYSNFGLVLATAVMTALAAANLFSALLRRRDNGNKQ